MRVLVIGSGAREHALCARLRASPSVEAVLCAPGSSGIARDAVVHPVATHDLDGIVSLATRERVDLVVVGPEGPLVMGIADRLATAGVACFGPGAGAARLEGSKSFSKDFMARHAIPTAAYASFTDYDAAAAYVRSVGHRVVVKADGLAAGKGVVVCDTPQEALDALDRVLRQHAFGDAGATVVVEERIDGQEISFHVIADGERYVVLGAAQDHKRLRDGDNGPNTGGMGAFSPVPVCTPRLVARICAEVVEPTLRGIAREGHPFRGVLFVGLMIDDAGTPKVLEYNVRFGDPECAVLLARLDGDLAPLLDAAARSALSAETVRVRDDVAIAVVIAAEGYPDAPREGVAIRGIELAEAVPGARVYHAGTSRRDGGWVTAGGRVLLVTATAPSLVEAAAIAYQAADRIELPGAQLRRDIGWRALAPSASR